MSDGPIAQTERCSKTVSISSSPIHLLLSGVFGALLGLFSSYLIGNVNFDGETFPSLLLYPFIFLLSLFAIIILIIFRFFLTSQSGSSTSASSDSVTNSFIFIPSHPSHLKRLRNYLAFFPITHLIHNSNNHNGGGSESESNGVHSSRHHPHLHPHFSDSISSDIDDPSGSNLTGRVSIQMDMAIDAIVSEYISPWYTKISDDGLFLEQCKSIIHTVFLSLGEKLRQVDRNELAKEAIQIIHVHWREYTEALAKAREAGGGSTPGPGPGPDEIHKSFRFVHPFLQDGKEVSKCYQKLVSKVLKELGVPDLSSPVMCQFIGGILVKNFILFYVDMICQPSWVNGSLMTLLSTGSMSVDITGSSSQNSSSPASPLPDPSPKPTNLFGDEIINDCASPCLTGDEQSSSSPTKKSFNSHSQSPSQSASISISAKSGESHEDEISGKCEQPIQQRSLESNSSASVDEGSSSEPKTESSAALGPIPLGKVNNNIMTEENNKWSSSTNSSSSMFPTEVLQPLTRRPRDLKPLKPGTYGGSAMRTVTTALGRVMQATAFPLLPSECYTEENSPLTSLPYKDKSFGDDTIDRPELLEDEFVEEISNPDEDEDEDQNQNHVLLSTGDSVFEPEPGQQDEPDEINNLEEERNESREGSSSPSASATVSSSKSVTSHYYSFDEASKRKPITTSFFETSTLSLDGAIEGRKQGKDQLQLCSHEYKHNSSDSREGGDLNSNQLQMGTSNSTSGNNGKPQRSPVYEEPEDFAASIAKLRSLLEQKGRKSSSPPPPPTSAPASACLLGDIGDVFESPQDSPAPLTGGSGESGGSDCGGGGGIGGSGTIPQISETCASETHTTPSSTSSMDISKGSSRFSFNETVLNPSESDSTSLEPNYTNISKHFNDDGDDNDDNLAVPEIKCCFRNVTIPKVENSAEAGGQYIYYCIQYEGVYFDEYDSHPQKLVYRTTTIKRKFKEFLTLQAHLEDNPACKPHLKGMKTPTRWLNVSLTKSDATVAHQRRSMLEKYLQQLCYHPIIGFCQEVLIFMAYGEDGFCSFEVGDPKDLLSHRLDKLAKKFTGVINSLKDALPSFELDLSHTPNTPKSEAITPSDPLKHESGFHNFHLQDKLSNMTHAYQHRHDHHPDHDSDRDPDSKIDTDLEETWMEKLQHNAGWRHQHHSQENIITPETVHSQVNELSRSVDDNDEHPSTDSPTAAYHPGAVEVDAAEPGKIFQVYPLAAAVTQLLCDVLWLPQYKPHPTSVATFMSISGKSLENYVMETMDIFLSEEAILGYLEWLTISISTGQSETGSQLCDVISNDLFSEQDLKNILKRRIPAWVRWMWGRNRLDLTIDRLTGLFQSPLVNHDLVLSLSELIFSKMVNLVDDIDGE